MERENKYCEYPNPTENVVKPKPVPTPVVPPIDDASKDTGHFNIVWTFEMIGIAALSGVIFTFLFMCCCKKWMRDRKLRFAREYRPGYVTKERGGTGNQAAGSYFPAGF